MSKCDALWGTMRAVRYGCFLLKMRHSRNEEYKCPLYEAVFLFDYQGRSADMSGWAQASAGTSGGWGAQERLRRRGGFHPGS